MTSPLHSVIRFLDTYKWAYISSALLLILSIGFRSLEPKILTVVVDQVITPAVTSADDISYDDVVARFFHWLLPAYSATNLASMLAIMALAYIIVSFIRGTTLFVANALKADSAEKAAKQIRDQAFSHIQRLPLSYFSTITRGELIQRCTGDIDTIKGFLQGQLIAMVRILAIYSFAFGMMAIVDWQYALISTIVAPVVCAAAFIFFKKEKKVWAEHEAETDKLNNLVQENLNGIRVVSAFANEKHEIRRFKHQNAKKREKGLKQNWLHTLFWPMTDLLIFLQILVSMMVGGYFVIQGRITIGELLGFYTYINMIAWPMRDLGRVLSEMGMAVVAMNRVSEIMLAAPEEYGDAPVPPLKGHIIFKNVTFGYEEGAEKAVSNIHFEVKPGEKVAIIGPTGAGKSTLIKLLLRLYEPSSGSISLDGQPLVAFSRPSLRAKIGIALQKAFLFSTSIRENIAYKRPAASYNEVERVAGMAQIGEIKQIFPDGFKTIVGEKGVTLSGGQKQRVALARTMLTDPDILVLDDITSAVDTETEQAIFRALATPMRGKTTLIISHRITSIQQADRILVMDKGKLVQSGTAQELENIPGYYQEIHRIQSAVESDIHTLPN
ncbi:MAG: ABC transporter ATP-binding protein [Bacteroidota bacterium]